MTDQTTPETGAQPSAAEVTVESILNTAVPEQEAPEQAQEPGNAEQETAPDPAAEKKKLENAISHQKGQAAKWRHQAQQARQEAAALAARIAKLEEGANPKKDGPPNEADYKTYAEYLEAKNAHAIDQRFAERDTKQTETLKAQQEAHWESQRIAHVDKQAEEFAKEFPDSVAMLNENAELIKSFSLELRRALLAVDNTSLAFYNLAKAGKLEELPDMSLEDAKVEIRLAQMKAPDKPKSKAPTPLPASRGSVPASKPLEQYTAEEAHKLLSK